MNRKQFFRLILIFSLLFIFCSFAIADTENIVIGGLLPLTGNASAQGLSYQTAIELAVEDVNIKYSELGLPYQVELSIADTESDPDKAKQLGDEMIQNGIHFIIGPLSSAEMKALENDAKDSDTILIGFGSTTPGLTSQENTIVRLCPDDTIQALALQRLFKKLDISPIIPVVRDDIYGRQFYDLINNLSGNGNFTAIDPIFYDPETESFNETIKEVSNVVKSIGSDSKIGVLIIGFDEAADILESASHIPEMESLYWFGTDAIALSDTIPKNKDIASFAAKTNFTATIFGELENEPSFIEFSKRIQEITGMKTTPYAIVINDTVQLAALTEMMSKDNPNRREIFVDNANHFYGVSGYTSLTPSGDRKFANIDYWRIKDDGNTFTWSKIGRFVNQMVGPIIDLRE